MAGSPARRPPRIAPAERGVGLAAVPQGQGHRGSWRRRRPAPSSSPGGPGPRPPCGSPRWARALRAVPQFLGVVGHQDRVGDLDADDEDDPQQGLDVERRAGRNRASGRPPPAQSGTVSMTVSGTTYDLSRADHQEVHQDRSPGPGRCRGSRKVSCIRANIRRSARSSPPSSARASRPLRSGRRASHRAVGLASTPKSPMTLVRRRRRRGPRSRP